MKNYKSLKDLTNKVVLITGASGGLGEQIAYQVAKKGAIVVACARRKEKLDVVVENCQNLSIVSLSVIEFLLNMYTGE